MKIRKQLIPGLIVAIVAFAGGVTYFKYDTRRKKDIFERWNREYPNITVQEHLDRTITSIMHQLDPKLFRNDPHSAWIVFDDSVKRRLVTGFELTRLLTLDEVLDVGDRVVKAANENGFTVYKMHDGDTIKYTFKLESDSGDAVGSGGNNEK